jgi:hypothetical protein
MAKISARNAKEIARWQHKDGATYVLCSDGRVLRKLLRSDGYHLVARFNDVGKAIFQLDGILSREGYLRVR